MAKDAPRFPVLQGVLPVDRKRIPMDIAAGVTLAALGIPEVMGYTSIAGMPVITGLYTILVPIAVFAVLGSSRHLVVGADSATAAIMAAGLAGMAATASPEYVTLAGMLALVTGGYLILARLLKLGFIANFLSRSVLVGFLTGVGIQVAMGQVGDMLGIPKQSGGTIEKFVATVADVGGEQRGHRRRHGGRHRRDPGLESDLPADPRRPHRRRRRHHRQLAAGPRRRRRLDPRGRAERAARLRLPVGHLVTVRVAARDRRCHLHRRARAECRHLARICSQVRGTLRRERRPRRPRPRQRQRRAVAAHSSSTAARPRHRWSTVREAAASSRA